VESSLRKRLAGFVEREFDSSLAIDWTVVPTGFGFTAGEPSTASIVALSADKAVDQDRRETLLSELCELWMAETRCSMDEVVGVISNPQTIEA
jgi:hypothetical protein